MYLQNAPRGREERQDRAPKLMVNRNEPDSLSRDFAMRRWGVNACLYECHSWRASAGELEVNGRFRVADDPLGSTLALASVTQVWFAVFDVFGIRRIINPAASTANITNLSPKENDPPVRVYTYPKM
jgi:hypothetical protein